MYTNEETLKAIITSLDSTRNVKNIKDINSLILIAKQVVIRALQSNPMNKDYIRAFNNISDIELSQVRNEKDTLEIVPVRHHSPVLVTSHK